MGNIGQGFTSADQLDVQFGGTSYSSAIVAGVAAVLRQAHPGSTATQTRNAIISSANPKLVNDGSTELDQGSGLVDAQAASQLLERGRVPDFLPRPDKPDSNVRVNIERRTDRKVLRGTVTEK